MNRRRVLKLAGAVPFLSVPALDPAEAAGAAPDLAKARAHAAAIGRAMTELRKLAPDTGSYVSESDFFEAGWQRSFWGQNYPRLRAIKARYDPDGLFFVHHGVGSEAWSADGFTRRGRP